MGIHQVTSAVAPAGASPVEPKPKQPFSKLLEKAQSPSPPPSGPPDPHRARAGVAQAAGRVEAARPVEATVARAVDQVAQAQHRLDRVLALAQSGRTFSRVELLGLQAEVYSASQQLDLAGKVVEKATSGVKQVLQTQI